MLALTVREGEYVTIGNDIVVQVLKTGDTFRNEWRYSRVH